eukprot:ANDGO_01294.mRNA.1 Transcription and mRNA export factor ENY2
MQQSQSTNPGATAVSSEEAEIRAKLYQRLEASGDLYRLRQLVEERLQATGWEDELRKRCKEAIRQKGFEHISLDSLVEDLTPMARATVPQQVRMEVMERIRQLVDSSTIPNAAALPNAQS